MKVALILQEKPASEPSPPPALLKKPRDVFDNLLGITDDISAKGDVSKSPVKKKPYIKTPKEGGARKIILLFMAEKVPENHTNIQRIMEILGLQEFQSIDLTLSSDLKLINIICGLQSHSSTYSCAFCEIPTKGPDAYSGQANARTIGSLKEWHSKFVSAGSKTKNAKNFKSVVNRPLLKGPDDMMILKMINIPELHLYLGLGNKIFDECHTKTIELKAAGLMRQTLYQWANAPPCNIVRVNYHGGQLEGPTLKKLLTYTEPLTNFLPLQLKKYGIALKALDTVAKSCFGMELQKNWKEKHEDFVRCFLELEICKFPKYHIFETHVPEFIEESNHSLGRYSEVSKIVDLKLGKSLIRNCFFL